MLEFPGISQFQQFNFAWQEMRNEQEIQESRQRHNAFNLQLRYLVSMQQAEELRM